VTELQYRRMKPREAVKPVPIYFLGMFGGTSLWDFFAEPQVDWLPNLVLAGLFTVLLVLFHVSFKTTPKYP